LCDNWPTAGNQLPVAHLKHFFISLKMAVPVFGMAIFMRIIFYSFDFAFFTTAEIVFPLSFLTYVMVKICSLGGYSIRPMALI